MEQPSVAYPDHRVADVVLRDGSTVGVRPVRGGDAPALRALLGGLSDRTRSLRFFTAFPNIDSAVGWAAEVDYDVRYGLVATAGPERRLVAHAGYEREPGHPERAEIAFVVADAFQRRGLGTIMLGQLAEQADATGITSFTAEVLPGNHQMIEVFRDSGLPVKLRSLPGVVLVELPT